MIKTTVYVSMHQAMSSSRRSSRHTTNEGWEGCGAEKPVPAHQKGIIKHDAWAATGPVAASHSAFASLRLSEQRYTSGFAQVLLHLVQ